MTATENATWQRFNDSTIPDATHNLKWRFNERADAPGASNRVRRGSRPYWTTDLSGVRLNERQKDDLLAMQFRNGGARPIMMRVAPFCEIGDITGRTANGEPIVTPGLQGVGTGITQTFQLRKRMFVTGYSNETLYYNITKPHLNYPVMTSLSGNPWAPMRDVSIFLYDGSNYLPVTSSYYSIDRDTGLLTTFGLSGNIYASGGFYILMLLPDDGIPLRRKQNETGNTWQIGSCTLNEPPGGA